MSSRTVSDPRSTRPEDFSALDWIGAAAASIGGMSLFALALTSRSFADIFHDFGGPLPALTRLAISRWFPTLLGGLVGVGVALGLRPSASLGARRAWIVAAFLVSAAGFALCLIGFYLPVFEMAGSIRED